MKRAWTAVAVGSFLVAVATAMPAWATTTATPCTPEAVRLPDAAVSGSIRAAEPSGRYQIGDYRTSGGEDRFVLWRDGVPADLALAGDSYPADVSSWGVVIGNATASDGTRYGWRRSGTGQVTLPTPFGAAGAGVVAINARGEIAGQTHNQDGWDQRAVVWSARNQVRVLTRPDGFNEATVAGIDDDGTVVGTVYDWDYDGATARDQRVVAWFPDGTWRFLPGTSAGSFPTAVAIRHGAVVGYESSGTSRTTLLWMVHFGGATVLASGGTPTDISTSGSVALDRGPESVLYQPEVGERPLPVTAGDADPVSLAGVTDGEQVYGTDTVDGASTPVRWSC